MPRNARSARTAHTAPRTLACPCTRPGCAPLPGTTCPTCHGAGTVPSRATLRHWQQHLARVSATAGQLRGKPDPTALLPGTRAAAPVPDPPAQDAPVPCPQCRKRHGARWHTTPAPGCPQCGGLHVVTYADALRALAARPERVRPPRPTAAQRRAQQDPA